MMSNLRMHTPFQARALRARSRNSHNLWYLKKDQESAGFRSGSRNSAVSRNVVAPCWLSAPALRKILDALFFRPRQQLILRLKSPAAVVCIAVEGQVNLQAVGQKLDTVGMSVLRGRASGDRDERRLSERGVSAQGNREKSSRVGVGAG